MGFGKERCPDAVNSPLYWEEDDLDKVSGSILICGNGDGALTDLFRARVAAFQQELLQDFLENECNLDSLTKQALQIEESYELHIRNAEGDLQEQARVVGTKANEYTNLITESMTKFVETRLRDDTHVTLYVRKPDKVSGESWLTEKCNLRTRLRPIASL